MFDMSVFGAGFQLVVNLFLIGMSLGLGIKASFELVDAIKWRVKRYMWVRNYENQAYQEQEDRLDDCLEKRELEIEFIPETEQEAEFEGQ